MKIEFKNDQITFNKQLNNLDNFVIDFISILNELDIQYVIISGYVSILFGRNRASEDIHIFVEKLNYEKFMLLWEKLSERFECVITSDPKDAYNTYLLDELAIRFARIDEFIPNMELKFPIKDVDEWTLKNRLKVLCNKNEIYISPIELQIAYKLFLSSEKDIEDAEYLYILFKEKLNNEILHYFLKEFKQEQKFKRDIIGPSEN